eukprot:147568_1
MSRPTNTAEFLEAERRREEERDLEVSRKQIEEKDVEIARLRELTNKGTVQKELQKVLLENRDMRLKLEQLLKVEEQVDEMQEEIVHLESILKRSAEEAESQRVDADAHINELTEQKGSLQAEVENLESILSVREHDEMKQAQTVQELEGLVARLREAHSEQEELIVKMKDGSKVTKLEQSLADLSAMVDHLETDNSRLANDLDASTEEIEQLREIERTVKTEMESKIKKIHKEYEEEIQHLKQNAKEHEESTAAEINMVGQLKIQIEQQDVENLDMKDQIRKYEQGFGVEEAMRDLRKMKGQKELREKELNELSAKSNDRENTMRKLYQECLKLKQLANVDETWGMDTEELDLAHLNEQTTLRSEVENLKNVVEHLESERASLLNQLRTRAIPTSDKPGVTFFGLTPHQMESVEKYADMLREGEADIPLDDQSKVLQEQVDKLASDLVDLREKYSLLQVEKDEIREQYINLVEREHVQQFDRIMTSLTDLQKSTKEINVSKVLAASRRSSNRRSTVGSRKSTKKSVMDALKNLAVKAREDNAALEKLKEEKRVENGDSSEPHSASISLKSENSLSEPPSPKSVSSSRTTKRRVLRKRRHRHPRSSSTPPTRPPARATRKRHARHVRSRRRRSISAARSRGSSARSVSGEEEEEEEWSEPTEEMDDDPTRLPPVTQRRFVAALHDLAERTDALQESSAALSQCETESARLSAALGQLYHEFAEWRRDSQKECDELRVRLDAADAEKEKAEIELTRYTEIKEFLGSEESSQIQQLERITRDATKLRIEQKMMARRYNALRGELERVRTHEQKVVRSGIEMERVLKTRIVQLASSKKIAEHRLATCQSSLDKSVPRPELDQLMIRYEAVNLKLSETLANEANLMTKAAELKKLEREYRHAKESMVAAKMDLDQSQEDTLRLQKALDSLKSHKESEDSDEKKSDSSDKDESKSIPKKLLKVDNSEESTGRNLLVRVTELEMRLSSAERTTKRMTDRCTQIEALRSSAEDELKEMEQRLTESQTAFHTSRDELSDVRAQLVGSIPSSEALRLNDLVSSLSRKMKESDREAQHHKTMTGIASRQAQQISLQLDLHTDELTGLKEAMLTLEERSDEKASLGKMNRGLIEAKLRETEALHKLREVEITILESEASLHRSEEQSASNAADSYQREQSQRVHLAALHAKLAQVKESQSASLSFQQAEILRSANITLMAIVQGEQEAAKRDTDLLHGIELRYKEAKLEAATQKQLLGALKIQRGDEQRHVIIEWNAKLRELKLSELQLTHSLTTLRSELEYARKRVSQSELTIATLQRGLVDQQVQLEAKDKQWREAVRKQSEDALKPIEQPADSKIREAWTEAAQNDPTNSTSLPPTEFREAKSVEIGGASVDVRQSIASMNSSVLASSYAFREEISRLHSELSQALCDVRDRDAQIGNLRQQIHLAEKRMEGMTSPDEAIEATAKLASAEKQRILTIAQQTIESLQSLLSQKNEAISKYKSMVERALNKSRAQKGQDQAEIGRLNEQLMLQEDDSMHKLKEAVEHLRSMPDLPAAVISVEEVDEIMNERDQLIGVLNSDLRALQSELDLHTQTIDSQNGQIQMLIKQLEMAQSKIEDKHLQQMVEKLKSDLRTKDDHQDQLRGAIHKLKGDMIEAAAKEKEIKEAWRIIEDEDQSKKVWEKVQHKSVRRIKVLEAQIRTLKEEAKTLRNDHRTVQEKTRTSEAARIEMAHRCRELKRTNEQLSQELDSFKRKQVSLHSKTKKSAEQKISKIHNLEHELSQLRSDLDRSAVERTEKEKAKRAGGGPEAERGPLTPFEKWDVEKRLQRRVSRLREKLQEKSSELSKSDKKVSVLLAQQRDFESMHRTLTARIRELEDLGKTRLNRKEAENLELCRQRVFELEDENIKLQKVIDVEHRQAIEKLKLELQAAKRSKDLPDLDAPRSAKKRLPADLTKDEERLYKKLQDAESQISDLNGSLLEQRSACMDLRFEHEHNAVLVDRLKRRVQELEDFRDTLKGKYKGGGMEDDFPKDKKELMRLVDSMRGIIDKLRQENNSLKKNTQSNVKYMALLKESKKLKKENAANVALQKEFEANGVELKKAHASLDRLEKLSEQYRRAAVKEGEKCAKLRRKLAEISKGNEEWEREIRDLRADLEESRNATDHAEQQLSQERTSTQSKGVRAVGTFKKNIAALEEQIRLQEAELVHREKVNEKLQSDIESLTQFLEEARVRPPSEEGSRAPSDHESKLDEKEFELRAQIKVLEEQQRELENLREENQALKNELGAFDMHFFDEIEDLKFREKRATELNALYEQKIKVLENEKLTRERTDRRQREMRESSETLTSRGSVS